MMRMLKSSIAIASILSLICCTSSDMRIAKDLPTWQIEEFPFDFKDVVNLEGPRGFISCPKPDQTTYSASLRAGFDASVPTIVKILKDDLPSDVAFNKIVTELPRHTKDLSILDYRLCFDFANGSLERAVQQRFIDLTLMPFEKLAVSEAPRPQAGKVVIGATRNRPVNIAIIKGELPQSVSQTVSGFMHRAKVLLRANGYFAHFEYDHGFGEVNEPEKKLEKLQQLLKKFEPQAPDYLVAVGTLAAELVRNHYLGKIPIIFLQVTDPVKSKLVRPEKGFNPDPNRGNIVGTTTGFPVEKRLNFILETFRDRRLGFVYKSKYRADLIMKERIEALAKAKNPPVTIVPMEVPDNEDRLNADQLKQADLFFGWLYLDVGFMKLVESTGNLPFIGADEYLIPSALVTTWVDDYRIGEIAAEKFLFQNLLLNIQLSDMPIENPDLMKISINTRVAKTLKFVFPKVLLQTADMVIE